MYGAHARVYPSQPSMDGAKEVFGGEMKNLGASNAASGLDSFGCIAGMALEFVQE